MNNYRHLPLLLTLSAVLLAAQPAGAALLITEVMSSGGTPDWFELTNTGGSTASISGYKMDDSSFAFGSSVALNGVTSLAPGESAIFIESAAPGTDIPSFRTFWGNISSLQIGSYTGSGVGLSSSGDGVEVFDSVGTAISQVSFGTATSGVSFGYNTTTSTFGGLSSIGQFGAFQSADVAHNIGSPGVIPEPGAIGLVAGALALGASVFWRRARRGAQSA